MTEYLTDALGEGQMLALDGMVTPTATVQGLEKALAKKGAKVLSVDLVSSIWEDRPPVPSTAAWLVDDETAGASAAEKLARLRQKLAENGASAMVVSRLDSVAWLLNLRAADLGTGTPLRPGLLLRDRHQRHPVHRPEPPARGGHRRAAGRRAWAWMRMTDCWAP